MSIESIFKVESKNNIKSIDIFIDWAIKKKCQAVVEDSIMTFKSNNILEFSTIEELLSKIKSEKDFQSGNKLNFFLETGAPKLEFLYPLIEEGNVYLVSGKDIKEYRLSIGLEKTDKNDVNLIREYFSKYPEKFIKLEKEQLELTIAFSKYNYLTKELVRLKNNEQAFEKEFGMKNILFQRMIKEIEGERKSIILPFIKSLKKYCIEIKIKGLGPIILGQYLAFSSPIKFHSLSAWREYLGLTAHSKYKDPTKGYAKGNIKKSPFGGLNYQFAQSLLYAKDPLYSKIKNDLELRFPDNKKKGYKMMIHSKTLNRIVSIRLKQVYEYFETLESKISLKSDTKVNSSVLNDEVKESSKVIKSKNLFNSLTLDDFNNKFK